MSPLFHDVVQPSQIKQHLPLKFELPGDISSLTINFNYDPHQVDGHNNLLTLTVFDPVRFRDEGHKIEPSQIVTIRPEFATPGYIAGELTSGEWQIVINTHMVLAPVTYTLDIQFSVQEAPFQSKEPING